MHVARMVRNSAPVFAEGEGSTGTTGATGVVSIVPASLCPPTGEAWAGQANR